MLMFVNLSLSFCAFILASANEIFGNLPSDFFTAIFLFCSALWAIKKNDFVPLGNTFKYKFAPSFIKYSFYLGSAFFILSMVKISYGIFFLLVILK